jgi:hypothetical protein
MKVRTSCSIHNAMLNHFEFRGGSRDFDPEELLSGPRKHSPLWLPIENTPWAHRGQVTCLGARTARAGRLLLQPPAARRRHHLGLPPPPMAQEPGDPPGARARPVGRLPRAVRAVRCVHWLGRLLRRVGTAARWTIGPLWCAGGAGVMHNVSTVCLLSSPSS